MLLKQAAALAQSGNIFRRILANSSHQQNRLVEHSQIVGNIPGAAAALRVASFADMPAGETRHLYCNRPVPEAWLARFDQALPAPVP